MFTNSVVEAGKPGETIRKKNVEKRFLFEEKTLRDTSTFDFVTKTNLLVSESFLSEVFSQRDAFQKKFSF